MNWFFSLPTGGGGGREKEQGGARPSFKTQSLSDYITSIVYIS